MRCVNTEALNRYEREQAEAEREAEMEEAKEKEQEANYRKFTKALVNNYSEVYIDLINNVVELADEYDIELDFDTAEDLFLDYMA